MLSYLLVNNHLDAALHLDQPRSSFQSDMLGSFSRGDSARFFEVYRLLEPNSKLEFYLHVYFLIYQIHPSLGRAHHIPKEHMAHFKDYIDSKGNELAKTNEFLEFYALPYIKQPL